MAAELSLLSLTQHQNQQLKPNLSESGPSWMWNPVKPQAVVEEEISEEDSWEVRAFAEDTGNAMGTTWPPRSYTCTFCRREFRSAQALGGHMNVHRRDRARLHQNKHPNATCSPNSTLIIPSQEYVTGGGGGLCFLYQLPNPNNGGVFAPKLTNPPATLLSIPPYLPNNMVTPSFPAAPINYTSPQTSMNLDETASICCEPVIEEELDLELRLGH